MDQQYFDGFPPDPLGDEQYTHTITELDDAIFWLSSDQMLEPEGYFRLPVRDYTRFRKHVRAHLDFRANLPPNASVVESWLNFRQMLEAVEQDGENVDRLLAWFEAFQASHVSDNWSTALHRIGNHPNKYGRSLGSSQRPLVESLRIDLLPRIASLRAWQKKREPTWLAGERTAWDDYLGERFFDEAGMSPVTYFGIEMRNVEYIAWWRRIRSSLTEEERGLLRLEVEAMTEDKVDGTSWDIPEADVGLKAFGWRDPRELQFGTAG